MATKASLIDRILGKTPPPLLVPDSAEMTPGPVNYAGPTTPGAGMVLASPGKLMATIGSNGSMSIGQASASMGTPLATELIIRSAENGYVVMAGNPNYGQVGRQYVARTIDELKDVIAVALVNEKLTR